MNLRILVGAIIGAILGAVLGPYIAAEFTTVYVFQAGEYRILGALIGALLGALVSLVSSGSPPKKLSMEFDLREGEKILVEVNAAYIGDFGSSVSWGRVRITNQRFLFKSDKTSMEWIWEYIAAVYRAKYGFNTHYIELRTTAGNKRKLFIKDDNIPIEKLLEIINKNIVKND